MGDTAYQNTAVIYELLFTSSPETTLAIAADPKYLDVRIGITSVLHSWGSAMTHHPDVHMTVPSGWQPLDLMQAKLPAARARALEAVPPIDVGEACRGASGLSVTILRLPCAPGRRQGIHRLPRRAQEQALVRSSMPSAGSSVQRPTLLTAGLKFD